jgi:hypothetical protein
MRIGAQLDRRYRLSTDEYEHIRVGCVMESSHHETIRVRFEVSSKCDGDPT